ncbi:uncharacterized protein PS065_016643 [Dugong dugon]
MERKGSAPLGPSNLFFVPPRLPGKLSNQVRGPRKCREQSESPAQPTSSRRRPPHRPQPEARRRAGCRESLFSMQLASRPEPLGLQALSLSRHLAVPSAPSHPYGARPALAGTGSRNVLTRPSPASPLSPGDRGEERRELTSRPSEALPAASFFLELVKTTKRGLGEIRVHYKEERKKGRGKRPLKFSWETRPCCSGHPAFKGSMFTVLLLKLTAVADALALGGSLHTVVDVNGVARVVQWASTQLTIVSPQGARRSKSKIQTNEICL